MKVWLDDERPMPSDFNVHVKTASEAILLVRSGRVSEISLDHDLGEERTGYDVAKFIEESAFNGTLSPLKVFVHSANPVGARNIQECAKNANKYWSSKQDFQD